MRQDKRTSGCRGAKKSGNQWAAQIQRGAVRTQLGSYDEELTAAIVFQTVDKEYCKVGFPDGRKLGPNKPKKPTPCACAQPAETYNADMSSRPSTYHLETLAENRLLQDQVQTLKKDIRELWSIVNRAYGNWKREELVSRRLRTIIIAISHMKMIRMAFVMLFYFSQTRGGMCKPD